MNPCSSAVLPPLLTHVHQRELKAAHVEILTVSPEYEFPTLQHKLTPANTLLDFAKSHLKINIMYTKYADLMNAHCTEKF